MAEGEIKAGEQEREALRIETQRLREELSDLKIEAEIRQDKLRHVEAAAERQRRRKPPSLVPDLARPQSASSELSPTTSNSSPTIATPPTKSASSTVSETPTPPSPPTSEQSATASTTTHALPLAKSRLSISDSNTTPRPYQVNSSRPLKHSRRPSIPISTDYTPSASRRTTLSRPEQLQQGAILPHSGSLHQIRGLRTKMTNLEQRLKSARSKLPAPSSTPPNASPRGGSALGQSSIPATVTMRSNKKRTGGSNASSVHTPSMERPSSRLSSTFTPSYDRTSSRFSFGIPQPSPSRDTQNSRLPSRDPQNSRPSSRQSLSSRQSMSHLPGATSSSMSRPSSRQSTTGAQTSLGYYGNNTQSESRRPRSSIGGSYASTHGHSASVSRLSNYGSDPQYHEEEENSEVLTPTPSRRTTIGKSEAGSAIPGLTGSTKKKIGGLGSGRRISSGLGTGSGDMGPPERKGTRKLSGVGETFWIGFFW